MLVLEDTASSKTQFIFVQVGCAPAHPPSPLLDSGWLSQFEIFCSVSGKLQHLSTRLLILGGILNIRENTVELDKQLFSSTIISND